MNTPEASLIDLQCTDPVPYDPEGHDGEPYVSIKYVGRTKVNKPFSQRYSLNPIMYKALKSEFPDVIAEYDNCPVIHDPVAESIDKAEIKIPSVVEFPLMFKQLKKYDHDKDVSDPLLNGACKFMKRKFFPIMGHSFVAELDECVSQLNHSASAGVAYGAQTKGKVVDGDTIGQYLQYFDFIHEHACKTLWGASLKNELRVKSKFLDKKTRLYFQSSWFNTLACMQLFGPMDSALQQAFYKTPVCIGLGMFTGWWNHKLSPMARKKLLDNDAGGWDASMLTRFLRYLCKFRSKCLNEEQRKRVQHIYEDLIASLVVLPNGDVLLMGHQKSGGFCTASDNSLVNYILGAYVWLRLVNPDPSWKNFEEFDKAMSMLILGDDVVYGFDQTLDISVSAIKNTLSQFFEVSGSDSFQSIFQIKFLSQSTIFDQYSGMYHAVPNREAMISTLLYSKGKQSLLNTIQCLGSVMLMTWFDEKMRTFCLQMAQRLLSMPELSGDLLEIARSYILSAASIMKVRCSLT